jgi:hypothetical protein
MSIRYLCETSQLRTSDRDNHIHLNIPGEFLLFPSAIRVFTSLDPNSEFMPQIRNNPYCAITFFHEYQHLLSFLGTTYGNLELFLELIKLDMLFEKDGVIRGIAKAKKKALELPRPLIAFLCQSRPSWLSKDALRSAQWIERAQIVMSYFQGHHSALFNFATGGWPFPGFTRPQSVGKILPEKKGMIGPHSGAHNDPISLGSHTIHEGAARVTEYFILNKLLADREVDRTQFELRDEQAFYQTSRMILYHLFEEQAPKVSRSQLPFWHSLVSDLSLMGPVTMYDLLGGSRPNMPWEDVSPGWRFWNACTAAARLATKGYHWEKGVFTRRQYVDIADAVCDELDWPLYDELIDIGCSQMETFFRLSEDSSGFPNRYYRGLLMSVWQCRRNSPHLIFNPLVDCQDTAAFAAQIGFPRIFITKDHVASWSPNGEMKLDQNQLFHMLHTYSIAVQLLTIELFDPFKCYRTHFGFSCQQSNGLCGVIPSILTPKNCPFMDWLSIFSIEV